MLWGPADTQRPSPILVVDDGFTTDLQMHTELREALLLLAAGALVRGSQKCRDFRDRRREGRGEGRGEGGAWQEAWLRHWPGRRRQQPSSPSWQGGPRAAARALLEQGKEHSRGLRLREAVACFEEADAALPGSADTLCMCAKGSSDCCYLDEVSSERMSSREKQLCNQRGIDYARRAMELEPAAALPHVAACISMGRMAVFSDNKTRVRLAGEAREEAEQALRKDPGSDLAHHLLGQWNFQMAQLPGIARYLIKLCYGADLPPGSVAAALQHYTRAAELNPTRLIHRVEKGRSHKRLGQRDAARAELEQALQLEVEDVNAWLQRKDAEKLLADLDRHTPRRWQRWPRVMPVGELAEGEAERSEEEGAERDS